MSFDIFMNSSKSFNCDDPTKVTRPSWSFIEAIDAHVNGSLVIDVNLSLVPKVDNTRPVPCQGSCA